LPEKERGIQEILENPRKSAQETRSLLRKDAFYREFNDELADF